MSTILWVIKFKLLGFIAEINDPVKTLNSIRDITSKCNNENSIIQLLNGRGIAGRKHISQATLQALKAFDRNENISKDLGLEICVRASFQRQISTGSSYFGY